MRISRRHLRLLDPRRNLVLMGCGTAPSCPICGGRLVARSIGARRKAWIGNYNRPWYCRKCWRHFARGKEKGR